MEPIRFTDSLGRPVELSPVPGGGPMYHIYVDRYFLGQIFLRNGVWVATAHSDELQADDLQILAGMVAEANEKSQG